MDFVTSWFSRRSAEAKWRCGPVRGRINDAQAKLLVKALQWRDKSAVLTHISELVAHGRGVQDDLLNQRVTEAVIKCFMKGTKMMSFLAQILVLLNILIPAEVSLPPLPVRYYLLAGTEGCRASPGGSLQGSRDELPQAVGQLRKWMVD
ncbi:hypothetical protein VaNZ11_016144 [Volvox africanus]|uniref:Uncharacterized protein n=1 Tax=Volvox africanus TaxID=51714 RepID=A0ABQ5SM05_9CHLO|nr:hypothetical protein VaNZ11_016144 [Volvox africanus]